MFERFTDRARRVVVLAQEEARVLHHNYIGTEHILLGLLREADGVAARVLERMGVSAEAVREKVTAIIGEGGSAPPTGHIPFTPRSKKVLELSLREALQLGHNYIGTEHILLGLVREGEGVAAQVLVNLGLELSWVRQAVVSELSRIAPPGQMRVTPVHRTPETPAAAKAGVQARRLAAGSAVGSQHYLLALLAQEDSLAARALSDLGVTKEAVEARLAELEPTGTSDETPEQAGARRISLRVEGELVVLELDDPKLASALEEAVAGRKARIIRGTDPEATGFPGLWSVVSRTVEDMTRRLRFRGLTLPTETAERTATAREFRDPADAPDLTQIAPYRPPEWDASVDAASFAVVNETDGTRSYLEVARDVDREALRAWLYAWIEANRTVITADSPGEASTLWFVVRPAGSSFELSQFGFGPGGPRGAAPTTREALVDSALRTLSAQV